MLPSQLIYTRFCEQSSRDRLALKTNQVYIAVVLLYCLDRHCNTVMRPRINDQKVRFKNVSCNDRYKYADLEFIATNVSNTSIAQELGIKELPAVVIYINGVPQTNNVLYGFFTEPSLINFIERAIGKEVDDLVKQRNTYDEKVQDAQLASFSNCCYSPCGWGYPYWYAGWGWRNWSCGGCCCW